MSKHYDLAVLIPSRNEEFLKETVEDILKNRRGKTEVVVGIDGEHKGLPDHLGKDVVIIQRHKSIGQRAITNECANFTRAKYVMKVDAHCSFDEGFDVKMIEGFKGHENDCMAPEMRNLHVFDWKCSKCGFKIYQDKINVCPKCKIKMKKKMIWQPRRGTRNSAYYFSSEPKFGYFKALKQKQRKSGKKIVETMSLQGSAFMCTRKQYLDLNICDPWFGSWGSQGIEVACKFWLSGNKVLVNRNTWYAHCFRTKSVFMFPYEAPTKSAAMAKAKAKYIFFRGKWSKQKKPLSWLVEKFWPVPGWSNEDLDKLKTLEGKQ